MTRSFFLDTNLLTIADEARFNEFAITAGITRSWPLHPEWQRCSCILSGNGA